MIKRYDNKKISQTHQVFNEVSKILGLKYMSDLWKKSTRHIYSWSADPDHCEIHAVNPLEKIKIMLVELKKEGAEDVIKSALQLLARPLGYEISPLKIPSDISKKKDIFSSLFLNVSEILKLASEHFHKKELTYREQSEMQVVIDNLKADLTEIQIVMDKKK
jgi:hypothetical protein